MTTLIPYDTRKKFLAEDKAEMKTKITEVPIRPEWVTEGLKKSQEMGVLNNSLSKGRGNLIGFVGEFCVLPYIKEGELVNTYDYDIISPQGTIDVKTKRCRSVPQDHYMCSIAAYNTKQKCTYYTFVRIAAHDEIECYRAWILGWIEKEKYFDEAKFLKRGEEDGDNGYIVKADCYNLPIKKLNDIEFFS